MEWQSRADERRKRKEQWHPWFALWPVHLGSGRWAWLQTVERRVYFASAYDGTYEFPEYRGRSLSAHLE
jgi:molybdopterin-guanine dinucleotide biosynthesis protein A